MVPRPREVVGVQSGEAGPGFMPWPPYLEQASVIATAGFVAIHGAGAGCEVVDVVVGASRRGTVTGQADEVNSPVQLPLGPTERARSPWATATATKIETRTAPLIGR